MKVEKTVESTNIIHSSQKRGVCFGNLVPVSKVPMDQSYVRSTKRALRQKRKELTIDTDLSAHFSIEELNTALLAVKSRKAAGFDGVYQEFIQNSGQRTKEWIVVLFNDILTFDVD
jgi:hypothetical protein